jgi:2,4-dienoyl-CoA reductase-like NADH-dependent reductase (Old Yellow Enzyme family)/thioredoxin reductase
MKNNNKYPHVFQPLTIRGLTLKNRLQYAPTVALKCSPEGSVTKRMEDFVEWQAKTGVAYITIGDTPISNENSTAWLCELNVRNDIYIPGMKRAVDAARYSGAEISVELAHAGRGARNGPDDPPALAPSLVYSPGLTTNLKAMDRADMDNVTQEFVDAAVRCKKADFRMIMIHCAHQNLLCQFLSPISNIRNDEYGGSAQNRMKYPLEVLRAVREAVGPGMVIEIRVSATEDTPGGLEFPESLEFMKAAQEYVDIIHISRGSVFTSGSNCIPTYFKGRRLNVDFAAEAKKVLHVPVAVVGVITSLEEAEEIIATGKADIVVMAKSLMADGELVQKSLEGRNEDICPCTRCDHCGSHQTYGLDMRCAVNPRMGIPEPIRKVKNEDAKNVMVIGGGPGGMTAARILEERGHSATLYEKSGRLGGLLNDATVAPFKEYLRLYLDWAVEQTLKCGAGIKLNTEVDMELIEKVNPDAIIVATGSVYLEPPIPGIDNPKVARLMEVEHHTVTAGENVVVCGGGIAGLECALALSMEGSKVSVVDMVPADQFCIEMPIFNRADLMDHIGKYNIKLYGNQKIKAFTYAGVETVDLDGKVSCIPGDTYVLALGVIPDNSLAKELYAKYPSDIYVVGDCVKGGRNFFHANQEAYEAAMNI